MLVLSRNVSQTVLIGDDIGIVLCRTHRNGAIIGVSAPTSTRILRAELTEPGQPLKPVDPSRVTSLHGRPASGMLKLERGIDQGIRIGDDITVWLCGVDGFQAKLGFHVPRSMVILRKELTENPTKATAVSYLRAAAC